jgi:hypothetical protein
MSTEKPADLEECRFVNVGMKVWVRFRHSGWQECIVTKASGDVAWLRHPSGAERAATLDLLWVQPQCDGGTR